MAVEIKIVGNDNGTFAIESNLPGPHSLIRVLRGVVDVVEKSALEAEQKAARQAAAAVRHGTEGDVEALLRARGALPLNGG